MQQLRGHLPRPMIILLMFLAIAAGGGWSPQSAFALSSVCRSDPLVILSNGATIDMNAALQTSAANVDHVAYRLHIPPGLRALTIISTRIVDGLPATVDIVNDAPANTYWTETTAYTRVPNVQVSAQSALILATHVRVGVGITIGREQQALRIDLLR